jgi:hypothetical protein
VAVQELGTLEPGWELRRDRPGGDPGSGEPDERIGLGDVDVADRGE